MLDNSTIIEGAQILGVNGFLIIVIKMFLSNLEKKVEKLETKFETIQEEITDNVLLMTTRLSALQERLILQGTKSIQEVEVLSKMKEEVLKEISDIREDMYQDREARLKAAKNSNKHNRITDLEKTHKALKIEIVRLRHRVNQMAHEY